jgi:hypothetical protein
VSLTHIFSQKEKKMITLFPGSFGNKEAEFWWPCGHCSNAAQPRRRLINFFIHIVKYLFLFFCCLLFGENIFPVSILWYVTSDELPKFEENWRGTARQHLLEWNHNTDHGGYDGKFASFFALQYLLVALTIDIGCSYYLIWGNIPLMNLSYIVSFATNYRTWIVKQHVRVVDLPDTIELINFEIS